MTPPPDPVYVRALLAERQHLRHRIAVLLWAARRARREAWCSRCERPDVACARARAQIEERQ